MSFDKTQDILLLIRENIFTCRAICSKRGEEGAIMLVLSANHIISAIVAEMVIIIGVVVTVI